MAAVGFFLIYLLGPLGWVALLGSWDRRLRNPWVGLVSLGLGPLLLSWVYVQLLTFFPGISPPKVLGCVALLEVLPLWTARRWIPEWGGEVATLLRGWRQTLSPSARWGCALALLYVGVLGVREGALPIAENDPLEHALVAQRLVADRSTLNYPALIPSEDGYYSELAHPLGFAGLWALAMEFQGVAELTPWVKLASPMYLAYLLLSVFVAGAHWGGAARGALAALLVLGAPLFGVLASVGHVDPLRIYALFSSVVLVVAFREERGVRLGLALGVGLGLALFAHPLGLLAPLSAVVLWLREILRRFSSSVPTLAAWVLACALVGGGQYVENTLLFGVPLKNTYGVLSQFGLEWGEYLRWGRNLGGLGERLLRGWGRLFLEPLHYGAAPWACLLLIRKPIRRGLPAGVLGVVAVGVALFALFAGSALVGVQALVMNERYALTLIPFAALGGSWALGAYLPTLRPWVVRATLVLFAAALVGPIAAPLRPLKATLSRLPNYFDTDVEKVRRHPGPLEGLMGIAARLGDQDRVLLFRVTDFAYYVRRPYFRFEDPRLKGVYGAPSPEAAWEEMRALGITHVFLSHFTPPALDRSPVAGVLGDPGWSQIVSASPYERLFRLESQRRPLVRNGIGLPRSGDEWNVRGQAQLEEGVGGVGLRNPLGGTADLYPGTWEGRARLQTECAADPVLRGTSLQWEGVVSGEGFLKVVVYEYDARGNNVEVSSAWERPLTATPTPLVFQFRVVHPETCDLVPVFRLVGRGEVTLHESRWWRLP